MHPVTYERKPGVGQHSARQQSCLKQDLEPITDAKHRPVGTRKALDRRHDGREASDCAGPQMVTMRKTAWQHNRVEAGDVGLLVPDGLYRLPQDGAECVKRV